jgi:TrmH family RNA methyltransferase
LYISFMSEVRTITSAANPQYRRWKKLAGDRHARRADRATLLEGAHLLAGALDAGVRTNAIMLPEGHEISAEIARLLARIPVQTPRYRLANKLFKALTELAAPTDVLAEIPVPETPAGVYRTLVLLDRVQDPGNAGAILRTAAAAGVDAVYASHGCADLWSPKVLRAGMGAHFRLALREGVELAEVITAFAGLSLCTAAQGDSLYRADLRGPTAWVFGNEGAGVDPELAALCQRRLAVPMSGAVESLNVAASAAVCLFEQRRQRIATSVS